MNKLNQYRKGIYTPEMVEAIAGAQQVHNALATRIAYAAGLRDNELLSLLPANERPISTGIHLFPERFLGREGERYTVTDKGGLIREVLIPRDLAAQLEARMLMVPVWLMYRGDEYEQHYAIGAGRGWGKSFIAASRRVYGWSGGPSMLRATYAYMRLKELQANGLGYRLACDVRSQEMECVSPRDRHDAPLENELKKDIDEVRQYKASDRCKTHKVRQSRLDKYREEIEYIRYELKAPINEIHLWLRKKHHLTISQVAIWRKLQKWKKEE